MTQRTTMIQCFVIPSETQSNKHSPHTILVVYGRAPEGYPINATDAPDAYIGTRPGQRLCRGRYLTPRPLRAYPEFTVTRTEFNADA